MMAFRTMKHLRRLRIATALLIVTLLILAYSGILDCWSHEISATDQSTAIAKQGSLPSVTEHRESAEQKQLCRQHGWGSFKPERGQSKRKVYDLFMINTELDWLEIRLNTTFDHVDYFVAVEARKTFTGLDKPLVLKENWDLFAPYHDKMIYHEVEYPKGFSPETAWDMEHFVRNAMYTQVLPRLTNERRPEKGDVILVADVDEIARPETLHVLRSCTLPRRLTLRSRFYYYSFQFLHQGEEWEHPQATFYEGSRTILPANLRAGDGGFAPMRYFEKAELSNAAWHCSSCFATMREFLTKMASFSHTSFNHEFFRQPDWIAARVRAGEDVWNRKSEVFDKLENNTDIPSFLLKNPSRFQYLLDRSGPKAGFSDYP